MQNDPIYIKLKEYFEINDNIDGMTARDIVDIFGYSEGHTRQVMDWLSDDETPPFLEVTPGSSPKRWKRCHIARECKLAPTDKQSKSAAANEAREIALIWAPKGVEIRTSTKEGRIYFNSLHEAVNAALCEREGKERENLTPWLRAGCGEGSYIFNIIGIKLLKIAYNEGRTASIKDAQNIFEKE
jgi:hypothetical protein